MNLDFTKWESDGRFVLSRTSGGCFEPWNDDFGRGDSQSITYFGSAEAREYYIQAEKMRYALLWIQWELECLKTSLRGCVTPKGRVQRKKLLELISGIK